MSPLSPYLSLSQFSRLFNSSKSEEDEDPLKISKDIPKGLYLFGDVGTGKR